MALPAGITTCVVTAGAPLDFAGQGGTITLTVTPILGGNATNIVWSATGQPLVNFPMTATADATEQAQVVIPHSDQDGFVNGAGDAFKGWSYKAQIVFKGANRQQVAWTKVFQIPSGQAQIDLDLVPDGSITSPTTAPTETVTSVNGQTGAVTVESGGVDDATLAGMVTDTGTATGAALAGEFVAQAQLGTDIPTLDPDTGDVLDASGQPVVGATDAAVAGIVTEPLTQAAIHDGVVLPVVNEARATTSRTVFYDRFTGPDRDLNGSQAPTGHIYYAEKPGTVPVVDGAYRPDPVADDGSEIIAILYTDLSTPPDTIAAQYRWHGDLSGAAQPVLGVTSDHFGNGSVQLALYPSTYPKDDIDWILFTFLGAGAVYITLASGKWANGFTPKLDTPYQFSMTRTGPKTVAARLPDGTEHVATHDNVAEYWQHVVGYQNRQPLSAGDLSFDWIAATGQPAPVQPMGGSGVKFDGAPNNSVGTVLPAGTSDDIEVRVDIDPDTLTQAVTCDAISQGSQRADTLPLRFGMGLTPTAHLFAIFSIGGAVTPLIYSGTVPPGTAVVAMTRTAATGDVVFYTASDRAAMDALLSDTTLWTVNTTKAAATTVGALDASQAPLRVGAYRYVSQDWYKGVIGGAMVRDGIGGPVLASLDLRGRFDGRDAQGNRWMPAGSTWSWALPSA